MSKQRTPLQYAKAEIASGKFAVIHIEEIAGSFYLCDSNWNFLNHKSYNSKLCAIADRSAILEKARKAS